jgi:hypothetical protein
MNRAIRLSTRFLLGALIVSTIAGCASYRLIDPVRQDPGRPDYHGKVVWSCLWGAVTPKLIASCDSLAVSEVFVESNVWFHLISVCSLGLVNPISIKWKCSASSAGADSLHSGIVDPTRRGCKRGSAPRSSGPAVWTTAPLLEAAATWPGSSSTGRAGLFRSCGWGADTGIVIARRADDWEGRVPAGPGRLCQFHRSECRVPRRFEMGTHVFPLWVIVESCG